MIWPRACRFLEPFDKPCGESSKGHRSKVRAEDVLRSPRNFATLIAVPVPMSHDICNNVLPCLQSLHGPNKKIPQSQWVWGRTQAVNELELCHEVHGYVRLYSMTLAYNATYPECKPSKHNGKEYVVRVVLLDFVRTWV